MTDIDRVYKLTTIKAPDVIDSPNFDASFFEQFETITEIIDHRIQFRVVKNLKREPNSAEIVLFNLSEPLRESFVSGPVKIRLEAGYENVTRLLFIGDLRYASNEHDGTEWLTKLQVADGARAFAHARVNRSYGKGTPYTTIVSDLAKAFGVPLPPEVTASAELKGRLVTGDVITGYASDELTRILAPFGMEWSFQNGRLQILKFDEVRAGTVRLISQDEGMIGAPSIDPPKIVAPPKAGQSGRSKVPKVPKLTVRHKLFPELTPGEKFQLQSRSINGTFRIDVVTHEGDNFGDDWTSTIEGVAA